MEKLRSVCMIANSNDMILPPFLVTGGGTGLGKGMATALSKLGATVAITGRREVNFYQIGLHFLSTWV